MFGVAYSSATKRIYAAFSYWNSAREGYVAAIAIFDEDLNLIKKVDGPAGWDYCSVTGIGVDKDGNVYIGGSRTGSFIYILKYDPGLNLLFTFAKDPIAPKMSIGGETIPDGGYYIINNEDTANTLHKISASGAEQWFRSSGLDIYIHGVDGGGNFYGVDNSQTPQFSKLGYADGVVKWTMTEPHSVMTNAVFIDEADRIYTAGYLAEPVGDADSYIARYTQGGAPKYSITKSTETDNQIVVVSSYTAPLVSIVNIFGTTTPASGIGINFTISTFPAGAIGNELTILSTNTNTDGFAETKLKLGNIPAEYGVTATCPSCVPEASSVTFTCCGKLPNDHFSQSGQMWSPLPYARHTITESSGTIGWLGCGLTSLATLINHYSDNRPAQIPRTNPSVLNGYLLSHNGYDAKNNVDFKVIKKYSSGLAVYVGRYDVDKYNSEEALLDIADGLIRTGMPLIFRVSGHFLLVIGKCGDNFIVADPAGGRERLYNPNDLTEREFEGLRIFAVW